MPGPNALHWENGKLDEIQTTGLCGHYRVSRHIDRNARADGGDRSDREEVAAMKITYETGKISSLGEMRSHGPLRYYEYLEMEQRDGAITRIENLLMVSMATPKIQYGDTATIAFHNGNIRLRGHPQIFRNILLGYATETEFAVGRPTRAAVLKEIQVMLAVGGLLILFAIYLSNPWSALIGVFALPMVLVSVWFLRKSYRDNSPLPSRIP